MTRNGNRRATSGRFFPYPTTYIGTGSSQSTVQMLPSWPRLLPRLGDLPSAEPTITVLTRSGQKITWRIANGNLHPLLRDLLRVAFVSDQGVRGSEDQRKTRRIGWLVGSASALCSPFPPPSHTHRPNPPSCSTLRPLFLRTISTLSFRRFRSVAVRTVTS